MATDLEFGVFDWIDVHEGQSTAQTYDDRIALARRADAGDFTRYHVAEHHGAKLGLAASPAMLLAAIARETRRIKLVPMTLVVPLYDPLRLVQEIAMLDHLSRGRVELGIGKGSAPHEAAFFGYSREDMAERYDAFVPAVFEALETGVFNSPVSGERIDLVVTADREFTQWYPSAKPPSIIKAAEHGQNTIFGFAFYSPPISVIREHRDLFFETRARVDHDGTHPRFGVLRHILVAETDEAAFELAEPAFTAHYANFVWLWEKLGMPQPPKPDLRELVENRLAFVGSAASVAEQAGSLIEETGVNYLAGAFGWGDLAKPAMLDSIDRFDREVIPAIRARLG